MTAANDNNNVASPKLYAFVDGQTIMAKTPTKFVEQMKSRSIEPGLSTADYMFEFADRMLLSAQKCIRFKSVDDFVGDLIKHGIITVSEVN
jgi:hypothetical protein